MEGAQKIYITTDYIKRKNKKVDQTRKQIAGKLSRLIATWEKNTK